MPDTRAKLQAEIEKNQRFINGYKAGTYASKNPASNIAFHEAQIAVAQSRLDALEDAADFDPIKNNAGKTTTGTVETIHDIRPVTATAFHVASKTFTGGKDGIWLGKGGHGASVAGCKFSGQSAYCIWTGSHIDEGFSNGPTDELYVVGNHFDGRGSGEANVRGYGDNQHFVGNTFIADHPDKGNLRLAAGKHRTVLHNSFTALPGQAAIGIMSAANRKSADPADTVERVRVDGNTFNGGAVITIGPNCHQILIQRNTWPTPPPGGIKLKVEGRDRYEAESGKTHAAPYNICTDLLPSEVLIERDSRNEVRITHV